MLDLSKNLIVLVTLLLASFPTCSLAQSQTTAPQGAEKPNLYLELGPVAGLTTAWYPAPRRTAIPLGAEARFRVRSLPSSPTTWTGAGEVERLSSWSIAETRFTQEGLHVVTVGHWNMRKEWIEESIELEVIDTARYPITVSDIHVRASPVEVDAENSNADTMRYYFQGSSIAGLREVAAGRYRTSVNRWLDLEVRVEPPAFAPLIEWRLNGEPQRHLGSAIRMQVFSPRLHEIEAGLTLLPKRIELETYWVRIEGFSSRAVYDGVPVTFTAVTKPPGYEDEITWLASTKYGSCEPLIGSGPEFTVTFDDTLGEQGRWLGVRADNQVLGRDEKVEAGTLEPTLTLEAQSMALCQQETTHALEVEWRIVPVLGLTEVEILVLLEDGTELHASGGPSGSAEFEITAPFGGSATIIMNAEAKLGVFYPDPARKPDLSQSTDILAELQPCEEIPLPEPGEGFAEDDIGPPPDPGNAKQREVDLAHLGGSPNGPLPTRIITAVGGGAAVRLFSWGLTGGTEPTLLESTMPIAGFDARLHVLTPELSPKLGIDPFLLAVRRNDGNLWLSTYTVEDSGEIVRHGTLGFGTDELDVLAYSIAHRPILDQEGLIDSYLVATPVVTSQGRLRLATWSVDANDLEIRGLQDSGDWGDPATDSFVDVTGLVLDNVLPGAIFNEPTEHEFVVNYRNPEGKLVSHFWHVDDDGQPFTRGSAASGLRINGRMAESDLVPEVAVAPLSPRGYVTAKPEAPSSSPRLIVWEPRITHISSGTGSYLTPFRIVDDTLDHDPGLGVSTDLPMLDDASTTRTARGQVTDVEWEESFGKGEGLIFGQPVDPPSEGIASVRKVMILHVVLKTTRDGSVSLEDEITISEAAVNAGGTKVGFQVGEIYTLRDLLFAMMMVSGNDATTAIGEHLEAKLGKNSMTIFNEEADALNLEKTVYGSHRGGGNSTPEDQITLWIAAASSGDPDFLIFTGTRVQQICEAPGGTGRCHLFRRSWNYPGIDGWKSGSLGFGIPGLPEVPLCTSSGCRASQATRLGRSYVTVVLQVTNTRVNSERLYNYAIRNHFVPDRRGDSGAEGGPGQEFGLDSITDTLAVTSVINDDGDLEVCTWQVVADLGQIHRLPGCNLLPIKGLGPGVDLDRARKVELVRISTLEVAGDFLRGILDGGQLELDVWRIGPELPPSRR